MARRWGRQFPIQCAPAGDHFLIQRQAVDIHELTIAVNSWLPGVAVEFHFDRLALHGKFIEHGDFLRNKKHDAGKDSRVARDCYGNGVMRSAERTPVGSVPLRPVITPALLMSLAKAMTPA